ncbi:hypothetical protein EG68_12166 [Paragonimus skrjabini miyazakii]|uniref:Uncharacterized protein n=1 Tax=Paragonimus skrjabini miyazakii TaxID=59628 RepID=A0A8S9YDD0_9TREM|nr:hypothetical protein EG68_12166 [Paragonimus skrjabini miyazakii]
MHSWMDPPFSETTCDCRSCGCCSLAFRYKYSGRSIGNSHFVLSKLNLNRIFGDGENEQSKNFAII